MLVGGDDCGCGYRTSTLYTPRLLRTIVRERNNDSGAGCEARLPTLETGIGVGLA